MYGKAAVLVWVLGLISAELLGIGSAYMARTFGVGEVFSGGVADIVTVSARLLFLAYVARATSVNFSNVIYKPLPSRSSQLILLAALVAVVGLLDYFITAYGSSRPYEPQLMGYEYYAERGAIWCFPFRVAYYLSEVVVVMNYMYVLAKKAWKLFNRPAAAGVAFLILAWALPHVFTKNVFVAAYAAILATILYVGYEFTGSPLTPIILWFAVLLV
ncbi:MAG: hypothetical protein J7L12_02270 [Desulfurococcales archaeon]|nr:hypothetical protein [Desulfurococcales archaeon]